MRSWSGALGAALILGMTLGSSAALAGVCAPTVTISPDPGWFGATVTIAASGFTPDLDVYFELPRYGFKGIRVADANGDASLQVLIDPEEFPPGSVTRFYIYDRAADCSLSGPYTVLSDPPPTTTTTTAPTTTAPATTAATTAPTTTATTTAPTTTAPTTTTSSTKTALRKPTTTVPDTTVVPDTTMVAAAPPSGGSSSSNGTLTGLLIGMGISALVVASWVLGRRSGSAPSHHQQQPPD